MSSIEEQSILSRAVLLLKNTKNTKNTQYCIEEAEFLLCIELDLYVTW